MIDKTPEEIAEALSARKRDALLHLVDGDHQWRADPVIYRDLSDMGLVTKVPFARRNARAELTDLGRAVADVLAKKAVR